MSLHNSTNREPIGLSMSWLKEMSESKFLRLSYKERKENALASGADEGRDKLR